MKKINFILPGNSRFPVGGYKIVFEYANRLVKDDYDVNIIFPATLLWSERGMKEKVKGVFRFLYYKINSDKYLPYKWFSLDSRIKGYWVPTLEEKYIPNADYTFATACETAEYLKDYSPKKGRKLYLIQGFEDWYFSKERLIATWKYSLKKIVISQWLMNVLDSIGEESKLIYNGLDFKKFNIDIEIEKKQPLKLMMLYHESKLKGTQIGILALKYVKEKIPNLEVCLFGTYKKPENLPEYIQYYQSPNQELLRKLYNESSIYIGTSYGEGWGLTIAEAMQCGCAIVCTDVNGYREMIKDNETGLLSASGDWRCLGDNILKLILDNNLRIKLAKNGNYFIQKFTWEKSYKKLKKILEV